MFHKKSSADWAGVFSLANLSRLGQKINQPAYAYSAMIVKFANETEDILGPRRH